MVIHSEYWGFDPSVPRAACLQRETTSTIKLAEVSQLSLPGSTTIGRIGGVGGVFMYLRLYFFFPLDLTIVNISHLGWNVTFGRLPPTQWGLHCGLGCRRAGGQVPASATLFLWWCRLLQIYCLLHSFLPRPWTQPQYWGCIDAPAPPVFSVEVSLRPSPTPLSARAIASAGLCLFFLHAASPLAPIHSPGIVSMCRSLRFAYMINRESFIEL